MALKNVSDGARTVQVEELTPVEQASTASAVVVTGSEIDSRPWDSVCYTIKGKTNTVTWYVYGANSSDYSDEVSLYSADVTSSATDSYAVAQAPYAYYRVKIITKVNPNHGSPTVYGIAKG